MKLVDSYRNIKSLSVGVVLRFLPALTVLPNLVQFSH